MEKNNVVQLFQDKTVYRYEKVVYKNETSTGGDTTKVKPYVLVVLRKTEGNSSREIILPVSSFILKPIPKKGIPKANTQLARARVVVEFLNYVFLDNYHLYKIDSLCDLNFTIGQGFLNSFKDSSLVKETVQSKERTLTQFYYYLAQNNVLDSIQVDEFDEGFYYYEDQVKKYTKSPFTDTIYPKERIDDVLHNLPTELIIPFIDTAMLYTPRIAFGVYCQFFGGLRVGEVVNMTKSSMSKKGPFCEYGLIVKLEDRNLRKELKSATSGGAVKKPRRQAIYPYRNEILMKIYKNHIENYVEKDDSGALFWGRNHKPMSDDSYRYDFNKLKNLFIQRLIDTNDVRLKNYAIELQSKKWSTHIGRGVFSNMIAEASKNISQIRQARGDSTFEAAMTYLSDTTKMARLLLENQIEMWEMLVEDVKNMYPEVKDE